MSYKKATKVKQLYTYFEKQISGSTQISHLPSINKIKITFSEHNRKTRTIKVHVQKMKDMQQNSQLYKKQKKGKVHYLSMPSLREKGKAQLLPVRTTASCPVQEKNNLTHESCAQI